MGVEIERKFLVQEEAWKKIRPEKGQSILQGYLMRTLEKTVRIRIKGNRGYITIKGETKGATRAEFEYEIPREDAQDLLNQFCTKYIDKVRYEIEIAGKTWEIDEFSSPRKGLILAEIELEREDESFALPDWIGQEVTDDPSYYNANMLS